jgi:hypothetical protein
MTGLDGRMPLPLRKIDCQGPIAADMPPIPQPDYQCALLHDAVLRSPATGARSVRDDDGADDVVQTRAHEPQRPPARSLFRVREVRAHGCRFGGVGDCGTLGQLLN